MEQYPDKTRNVRLPWVAISTYGQRIYSFYNVKINCCSCNPNMHQTDEGPGKHHSNYYRAVTIQIQNLNLQFHMLIGVIEKLT